jgi:hypothetical protein
MEVKMTSSNPIALGNLFRRAAVDLSFRQLCLSDARAACSECLIELSSNENIHFLENNLSPGDTEAFVLPIWQGDDADAIRLLTTGEEDDGLACDPTHMTAYPCSLTTQPPVTMPPID